MVSPAPFSGVEGECAGGGAERMVPDQDTGTGRVREQGLAPGLPICGEASRARRGDARSAAKRRLRLATPPRLSAAVLRAMARPVNFRPPLVAWWREQLRLRPRP